MDKKSRKKVPTTIYATDTAALTSKRGMGGLDGCLGYRFQPRYVLCHVLAWLNNPDFTQLVIEGAGDVDVRYGNASEPWREHIQIKDYAEEITKTRLKEIVADFSKEWDQKIPDAYKRFTLACPGVHKEVRPLIRHLDRVRRMYSFYNGPNKKIQEVLAGDHSAIRQRISKLELDDYADFIIEKVHFDVGLHAICDPEVCINNFIAAMQKYPAYKGLIREIVEPVYYHLFCKLEETPGTPFDRTVLEAMIDQALTVHHREAELEAAINLAVHNWTSEALDVTPDYTLDWTQHFDRDADPRRVPGEGIWHDALMPQLRGLRNQIRENTTTRLIRLRGKCCLSTGLALGNNFPENAGWVFEVPQPPQTWRSDAPGPTAFPLQIRELGQDDGFATNSQSGAAVLVIGLKLNAVENVRQYLQERVLLPSRAFTIEPRDGPNRYSIANESHAVSFALALRAWMDKMIVANGIKVTHLFYNGPFALAVFLGQRLTAVGRIQTYEFLDPDSAPYFAPACLLRT